MFFSNGRMNFYVMNVASEVQNAAGWLALVVLRTSLAQRRTNELSFHVGIRVYFETNAMLGLYGCAKISTLLQQG